MNNKNRYKPLELYPSGYGILDTLTDKRYTLLTFNSQYAAKQYIKKIQEVVEMNQNEQ